MPVTEVIRIRSTSAGCSPAAVQGGRGSASLAELEADLDEGVVRVAETVQPLVVLDRQGEMPRGDRAGAVQAVQQVAPLGGEADQVGEDRGQVGLLVPVRSQDRGDGKDPAHFPILTRRRMRPVRCACTQRYAAGRASFSGGRPSRAPNRVTTAAAARVAARERSGRVGHRRAGGQPGGRERVAGPGRVDDRPGRAAAGPHARGSVRLHQRRAPAPELDDHLVVGRGQPGADDGRVAGVAQHLRLVEGHEDQTDSLGQGAGSCAPYGLERRRAGRVDRRRHAGRAGRGAAPRRRRAGAGLISE